MITLFRIAIVINTLSNSVYICKLVAITHLFNTHEMSYGYHAKNDI